MENALYSRCTSVQPWVVYASERPILGVGTHELGVERERAPCVAELRRATGSSAGGVDGSSLDRLVLATWPDAFEPKNLDDPFAKPSWVGPSTMAIRLACRRARGTGGGYYPWGSVAR